MQNNRWLAWLSVCCLNGCVRVWQWQTLRINETLLKYIFVTDFALSPAPGDSCHPLYPLPYALDYFPFWKRLQLLGLMVLSIWSNCDIFFVEDSIVGVLIPAILPCSSISPNHEPGHLVMSVLFYMGLMMQHSENQKMMQITLDDVCLMVLRKIISF